MKFEIVDLCFEYGKTEVLHNINVLLDDVGVCCLLGPNGSGKSTLIKCIMQFYHSRGGIFYNNMPVDGMKQEELATLFAYVPQDCKTSFSVTVFDLILLGRMPYMGWKPSEEDYDIVSQNITLFGLERFALKYLNQLSGGERQKVMIAAAICQNPQVLLLDEPTSSLDIKHQIEVMRHVKYISEHQNTTVIVAMHDLNLASQYSTHVVMLKNGCVFAQGVPKEVLTQKNIEQVYGIHAEIYQYGNVQHIVPTEVQE